MDSILEFWHQMTANPLPLIAGPLTLGLILVIAWRDIYGCLEACADACEHVSECVGTVIMKNT